VFVVSPEAVAALVARVFKPAQNGGFATIYVLKIGSADF
jgi:hypothetical protein